MKTMDFWSRTTRLLLLGTTFFFSCNREENGIAPELPGMDGEIIFETGFAPAPAGAPQQRVTTDYLFNASWEEGDEIGIYAVHRTNGNTGSLSSIPEENYFHNIKVTYSSVNGGSWIPETPLFYPEEGVLDFYAYYPYTANMNPRRFMFKVSYNQAETTGGKSNYNSSDLLTASSDNSGKGWSKGDRPVLLSFNHAMAMVQVNVNTSEITSSEPVDLTVILKYVETGAEYDLASSRIVFLGLNVDIVMYKVEQPDNHDPANSYIYRAVLPADNLYGKIPLFTIRYKDREFTSQSLPNNMGLQSGRAELFSLTPVYD